MDRIWVIALLAGCGLCAAGAGEGGAEALLQSGTRAVSLMLELMASMTLWSGLMELLAAAGDVARLGRALAKAARHLFPHVQDEEGWAAVGMNVAANVLGLGNAATPAGIRAAQRLAAQGEEGVRVLALLLALNNSSLQLIPATVMTLRGAAGAAEPADIWLPTMVSSLVSTVVAAGLMLLLMRTRRKP
ncbi:MAG: spore maturation protein A [Aristaeellaceae bacterium]